MMCVSDLEKAVEQLSQMLDEPIEEDSVMDLRRKVLDKTVGTSLVFTITPSDPYCTGVGVRL